MSAAQRILERLQGVRKTGQSRWRARCPAHGSRGGTLAIAERDDRVLLHCFAGCDTAAVLSSVDLTLADLFDRPLDHTRAHTTPAWRAGDVVDLVMEESTVIALVGNDCLEQRQISQRDWERLAQAVRRINRLATMVRA